MSLVLDSSTALAWVYEEEPTEAVRRVFAIVAADGAWVPSLWRLEVANILENGVRRGRTVAAFRDGVLLRFADLPIMVDPDTDLYAWSATLCLAIRHRLTLYDAAYLELAQRRRLPLATLDRDLRTAAKAEMISLVGDEL